MSTLEELSKEIAASIAGLSHDANFKTVDGEDTLDHETAIYQYLPKQNVMVMINAENQDVEIWYDPQKTNKDWFEKSFKSRINNIARRYLFGTTVRSYAGDIEPKNMVHRTDYELKESRNTTKTSYHPLGGTKIILRHTKPVTEEKPGSRSRNIGSLFIEHAGERFRFPYNHLLGARVMALHVESGGKPWDENGEKILEISRRRKDVMELLRWSRRLEETEQVTEIRTRAKSEVIMLKRMMERAARTGDLSSITSYIPSKDVTNQTMVSEAVANLSTALDHLLD